MTKRSFKEQAFLESLADLGCVCLESGCLYDGWNNKLLAISEMGVDLVSSHILMRMIIWSK